MHLIDEVEVDGHWRGVDSARVEMVGWERWRVQREGTQGGRALTHQLGRQRRTQRQGVYA